MKASSDYEGDIVNAVKLADKYVRESELEFKDFNKFIFLLIKMLRTIVFFLKKKVNLLRCLLDD